MARDNYLQAAFEQVCREAKPAAGFYVSLMERTPYYGGPEDGGWWGHDTHAVAYQHFSTEEAARSAHEAIKRLAKELSERSRREFGEHCLREMEWLEARGLDADFLPEPDGESEFYVLMTDDLPEESRGSRQWD